MAEIKGFSDRVERWLSKIPGIRTYRDREHRRETDKKFREHLADRLQEVRFQLKNCILELNQKSPLNPLLTEIDRLSSKVQQMGDTIRFASYGYAGIFDLEKIREEELNQLYEFDLSLMEDASQIQTKVKGMDLKALPEQWKPLIAEASLLLDGLELKFRRRHDFMMKKPA
jgi:hypothetical protein